MMFYLYSLLFYLLQPFIGLRLLLRSRHAPAYRHRWLERYGINHSDIPPHGLLIHAVSMGETLAAVPLVKKLQQYYPHLSITFTTTTPTGSAQVLQHFGESVHHCYLPYDLPGSMRRFLNKVKPCLMIIMETEIWPNLLHQLDQKKIPIILANARLSERSAQRYQKIPSLIKVMNKLTLIAAQSEADAIRFKSIGYTANRIKTMGNLKFNLNLNLTKSASSTLIKIKHDLGERPIWIAGSTHRGEEAIILMAHQQLLQHIPNLLLILVPRHPERFNEVELLIQQQQLSYQLRSSVHTTQLSTQVLLGNTMGELRLLYAVANVAFIGGSLIEHGGQNPLEAIYYGIPVLMGPSRFNFNEICQKLQQEQLLLDVTNHNTIVDAIQTLLDHPVDLVKLNQKALTLMQQNQQALTLLIELLTPYLPQNTVRS